MAISTHYLHWPQRMTPVLRRGGRFPMVARNPGLVYVTPGTVALHVHDYAGRMWLGRRLVRLQPGDFTLTPAMLASNYDLDAAGFHLCVHFETVANTESDVMRLPLHWRPGPHTRALSERLQEIIHLFRLGEGAGNEAGLAKHAANQALLSLLYWIGVMAGSRPRLTVATATRVDEALEAVRRQLDEHYRAALDVPALARKMGVSQNYLARKFRAKHGMTLLRYVLWRRVELARHLLAATRLPLKAVAIEAGLGNPQYFHRQFCAIVGHSPSEERELAMRAGK